MTDDVGVAALWPANMTTLKGCHALLIGTGRHVPDSELIDHDAIQTTVNDLAAALERRCGMIVQTLLNPENPMVLGEAIASACEAVPLGGSLLVFYVGHGLVGSDGQLYLAASCTLGGTRTDITGFPYATLRSHVRNSAAIRTVVIIDACYSGRAADTLADADTQLSNLADCAGAFVMTSAGRSATALAVQGERHTAFTGALIRLLLEGQPDGPPVLTLRQVFANLLRVLTSAGRPQPHYLTNAPGDVVLTDNVAAAVDHNAALPIVETADVGPLLDACPYKGLAAFDVADAGVFFGRETATADLLRRLADRYDDPQPLFVTGPSGSGKSSLLQAGLMASVRRGALGIEGSAHWPQLHLVPTEDPIHALARALEPFTALPVDTLAERIAADPECVREILLTATGNDAASGRLLLIVDQFEELFTECSVEATRRAFVRALAAAASTQGRRPAALVVIGVRSDHYGRCGEYPQLVQAMEHRAVMLQPMNPDELRSAITRPAQLAGLGIEKGLVERLLAEVGGDSPPDDEFDRQSMDSGRLPLLSHALMATWQRREGRWLTLGAYEKSGGIRRALAETGNEVIRHLDEQGGRIAQQLLIRLVHVGEGLEVSRRRLSRTRLISDIDDSSRATHVLDVLAADGARIVTVDGGSVRITHEALLRVWPALRRWIDADRAGLLIRQQLIDSAHEWEARKGDAAFLYRGSRLAVARDWAGSGRHQDELGPIARKFLQVSVATEDHESHMAERRTRRRKLTTMATAILTVLLLTTALVYQQQRAGAADDRAQADQQRRIAAARSLAFEAESMRDTNPALALRLGIAAARIDNSADTHNSLVGTLIASHYGGTLRGHTGGLRAVSAATAGSTVVTSGRDNNVIVWDLSRQPGDQQRGQVPGSLGAISDDGQILLSLTTESTATLWDVSGGPDFKRLADIDEYSPPAVSLDRSGVIALIGSRVWDLGRQTGRPRHIATLDERNINMTALSVDGRRAVTAGPGPIATLWDLTDPTRPRQIITLRGHRDTVRAVALSSDGQTIITGSADQTAKLWRVDQIGTARPTATLPWTNRPVSKVAISHDGSTAILADQESNTAALWDISTPDAPRKIKTLAGHSGPVTAVALSADGTVVLTGSEDRTAIIWRRDDHAAPRLLATLNQDTSIVPTSVAFSTDRQIALMGDQAYQNRVLNIADPIRVTPAGIMPSTASASLSVAISKNGMVALTGNSDHTAIAWNLSLMSDPRQIAVLSGHTAKVTAVSLDNNGRTALTGSTDAAMVWKLTNGKARQVGTLKGHKGGLTSVALSGDGRLALTGSQDATAIIWDLGTDDAPRRLSSLTEHSDAVTSVALSDDGRLALTGSRDGTALVWDLTSPNTPVRVGTLAGHTSAVLSVAMSGDGRLALTGSADDSAKVWDLTGSDKPRPLATIQTQSPVMSIALTEDGHFAATVTADHVASLWGVVAVSNIAASPLSAACALAGGGLTEAEWDRYVKHQPYAVTC